MTLSSSLNRNNYTADGVQTVFAYQFRVDDEGHMKVYLDDVLQASGYAVSNVGEESGGNVTLTAVPAAGVKVTLLREVPLTQPTDIPTQGPLNSTAIEKQLDQDTMKVQQLAERMDRSVQLPVSSELTGLALPNPAAGNLVGWTSAADGLQNYAAASIADSIVPSAFAAMLLDDGDAETAQATLALKDGTAALRVAGLEMAAVDAVHDTEPNTVRLAWSRGAKDTAEAARWGAKAWSPFMSRLLGLSWMPESGDFDVRAQQVATDIVVEIVASRGGAVLKRITSSDAGALAGKTLSSLAVGHGIVALGTASGLIVLNLREGAIGQSLYDTASSPALADNDVDAVAVGLSQVPTEDRFGARPSIVVGYGTGADAVSILKDDWATIYDRAESSVGSFVAVHNGYLYYTRTDSLDQVFRSAPPIQSIAADDWARNNVAFGTIVSASEALAAGGTYIAGGDSAGLDLILVLNEPEAHSGQESAEANITRTYNTGWMPGATKGAWLANSATADRSTEANTLTENGTLTETEVASGSQLKGYSGWSTSNYLSLAANADFDPANPVTISLWFKANGAPAAVATIFDAKHGLGGAEAWLIRAQTTGEVEATLNGQTVETVQDAGFCLDNAWHHLVGISSANGKWLYIDGKLVASSTSTALGSSGSSDLTIGVQRDATLPWHGALALIRVSATAIDADFVRTIYASEKPLFEANATCLLPSGTTDQVDAVAVDPVLERVFFGQADAGGYFDGLTCTTIDATALAGGAGIDDDWDALAAYDGDYGVLTALGQHYVSLRARSVEDGLRRRDSPRAQPAAPCSRYHLAALAANVTGDATAYDVAYDTIEFENPSLTVLAGDGVVVGKSGKWLISGRCAMEGLTASHTAGTFSLRVNGTPRATAMSANFGAIRTAGNAVNLPFAATIEMNAGDKLVARLTVENGTKVVDVTNGAIGHVLELTYLGG